MPLTRTTPIWAAIVAGGLVVALRSPAGARPLRPLFEPTDLEMEDVGIVEFDIQVGGIRSPGPWRVVVPDFEVDLGLLPNLEVDVDGAYAVEGPASGPFSFDHAAPDSLWPSVKVGVYDDRDGTEGRAVAAGVQAGPKLPVAAAAHGVGFEALMLLGLKLHRLHGAVNVGGFVEPSPGAAPASRPKGFELGIDLGRDLGGTRRLAWTAEVSGVRFTSGDPSQLLVTAGLTWSATELLDLSAVALVGILDGNDRYGVLLGASPKVRLFGAASGR